jgi:hypothetical protein
MLLVRYLTHRAVFFVVPFPFHGLVEEMAQHGNVLVGRFRGKPLAKQGLLNRFTSARLI